MFRREPSAGHSGQAVPADAQTACRVLREAAQLNLEDPVRQGSLLTLGSAGQLVMTGDMHGSLRNFAKLQRYCALESSPARYVILHELIHMEPEPPDYLDLSIDLLVQAARWKCDFPDQVFFLQSNHELSQLRRHEITKAGRSVLQDFERGVERRYGGQAAAVLRGVEEYIASLPLAARTVNGIFLCHSLPDPLLMESFDMSVFERLPTAEDLSPGGSGYALVWGRFHTPRAVHYFADRLGVRQFVVGHMPQETGYAVVGDMLIIASDHAHGVFLPIDLSRAYSTAELEAAVRKFVSVE